MLHSYVSADSHVHTLGCPWTSGDGSFTHFGKAALQGRFQGLATGVGWLQEMIIIEEASKFEAVKNIFTLHGFAGKVG